MPDNYERTWLRIVNKLRSMITVISKSQYFALANLKDRGITEGMQFVTGTLGLGQIGERAPVSKENLQAYTDMLLLYELWPKSYGNEKTKDIFGAFLKAVETELFARSHNEKTVMGPVAEAVSTLVVSREYEDDEE